MGSGDLTTAAAVLTAARGLVGERDRGRLDVLAERLVERRLRVLVAGEAKRGKSTLINALLGRDLLPTGVTPLTSVATTVLSADGDAEYVQVRFADGHTERAGLDRLAAFVTEHANPNNRLGAAEVTVRIVSPFLAEHALELVDTPGTGSVYAHNSRDAREALKGLDAAVLVLTADPPISEAERDLLQQIATTSLRTFVVLNKVDRLNESEVAEAFAFTQHVTSEAVGSPLSVTACSARSGLADPGFATFARTFIDYVAECGDLDAGDALQAHVCRALVSLLDDARVRLRSVELARSGHQQTTDELRRRLESVAATRQTIEDRLDASVRRLRRQLDQSATAALAPIRQGCIRATTAALDGPLALVSTDELAVRARQAGTEHLARAVDRWREETATELERGLAEAAGQARDDVDAQVRLAREAVQQALSITLSDEPADTVLAVDARFRYDFSAPAGWAPPLQGALSRLATARHRRERARTVVLGEIASLTDRQLGRARSDLQQRLQRTGRSLSGQLKGQFTGTVERLLEVLSDVTRAGDSGPGDGPADQDVLEQRVRGLADLIADLFSASGGTLPSGCPRPRDSAAGPPTAGRPSSGRHDGP